MKNAAKIIAAAAVIGSFVIANAGEVVIKPIRYSSPSRAQFVKPLGVPLAHPSCALCKEELVATKTQDTKLKEKTVSVAKHGCSECKTFVKLVGAQKATARNIVEHSCAGKVATVGECCGTMAAKE